MTIVTSLENEHIKELKKLKIKKYRQESELFLAEGSRLVEEAIKAGCVQELILSESSTFSGHRQLPVTLVSERVVKTLSDTETSQGVIAVCRIIKSERPERLPAGFWIAVDNLADPGNLGTIIRTAWGTGMRGVVLLGEAVDPYNSKVVRASMGGIFSVPIITGDYEDIYRWQAAGHKLVVATAAAATDYYEAVYNENLIVVVGSEAHGVTDAIEGRADLRIRLPLEPGVDSLNAAVCAGVIMYEIKRQFH